MGESLVEATGHIYGDGKSNHVLVEVNAGRFRIAEVCIPSDPGKFDRRFCNRTIDGLVGFIVPDF